MQEMQQNCLLWLTSTEVLLVEHPSNQTSERSFATNNKTIINKARYFGPVRCKVSGFLYFFIHVQMSALDKSHFMPYYKNRVVEYTLK